MFWKLRVHVWQPGHTALHDKRKQQQLTNIQKNNENLQTFNKVNKIIKNNQKSKKIIKSSKIINNQQQ